MQATHLPTLKKPEVLRYCNADNNPHKQQKCDREKYDNVERGKDSRRQMERAETLGICEHELGFFPTRVCAQRR